ncbi:MULTISPECIES: twin-arginine translocase subunit TatC [Aquimarina]|uniref:Sec-independent protein translocase protein TatC n=1 Tax=Aquimarina algiphila TaxID=2047982 RepID=A0A554VH90_9FLAO|nr:MULTISPECIES: twin-arginine translocase subunit TatC [Aquimarina]TSE06817.1 twin-arginine translocase subunit TatC [Aquimarina algiphila]
MKDSTQKDPQSMSFLDHLEELRWHLIRATVAVLIAAIAAFMAKEFIFDVLIFGPKKADFPTYNGLCNLSKLLGLDESLCFKELPFSVQSRKVAGQFSVHIWTSITAGFIAAFPYVLYEFWKFIAPALYDNERKTSKGFIIICSSLFFLGVLFGYYVITPLSINFLGGYQVSKEVLNEFDIDSYIALVRASVIACGLIFELPVIMFFLTKVGLVTPEFLKKYRKFALVIVLILSAIITPPDIASQVIVTIPILILYEVSIIISKVVIKKEKQKLQKTA